MNLNLMPDLMDFIVCPTCRGRLDYTDDADGLACQECAVVYPIEDSIPILLVEEAVPLENWEAQQAASR